MMKTKILDKEGKAGKEIELPEVFSSNIREDIVQKYFEAEKKQQPYAPYLLAGKLYSASGKIRHMRNKWKTAYGKGISRVPRKIFWRRGDQFYWQGATIASAVGGRRAHPPRVEHFLKKKKINKKEKLIAIASAITSTVSENYIKKRYESLKEKNIKVPLIISSEILKLKTKEFYNFLKIILGENFIVVLKTKTVRAGKGKARGRRYKENAGLLLVTGKEENAKFQGIEIKKVSDLEISDLYPLGRLTVYTEKSVSDLSKLWEAEKK